MDCLHKIVESVVVNHFTEQLKQHAGVFQHGFIHKRGTHTAMQDFFKHIKVYKARRSTVHHAFIDVEKA